ncbi:hypothetical protein, partial [Ramlibacter sp.]|uniref:hypothetical protein n=1 Tax=Ramlibacter sp. TaxID=1917967 RepID=UPI0025EFFE03
LFVERLICSEELGNRHQTPTLIGCMFLMNPGKLSSAPHLPSCYAAISEALDHTTTFKTFATIKFNLTFAVFACAI